MNNKFINPTVYFDTNDLSRRIFGFGQLCGLFFVGIFSTLIVYALFHFSTPVGLLLMCFNCAFVVIAYWFLIKRHHIRRAFSSDHLSSVFEIAQVIPFCSRQREKRRLVKHFSSLIRKERRELQLLESPDVSSRTIWNRVGMYVYAYEGFILLKEWVYFGKTTIDYEHINFCVVSECSSVVVDTIQKTLKKECADSNPDSIHSAISNMVHNFVKQNIHLKRTCSYEKILSFISATCRDSYLGPSIDKMINSEINSSPAERVLNLHHYLSLFKKQISKEKEREYMLRMINIIREIDSDEVLPFVDKISSIKKKKHSPGDLILLN